MLPAGLRTLWLVRLSSDCPELPVERVRSILAGLPDARGYRVHVKPLRYRQKPHLSAWTDFHARQIVLQVPEPFFPFGEVIAHAARRRPGNRMRFIWLTEGITFRTTREVLRYLYLHEWMHWYLKERLGRSGYAETACDRFALRNFRRRSVTVADADAALARQAG
jgi:hypothetical protein